MEQKERAVIYRSFHFQTPFTLIITQAQTVYIIQVKIINI